MEHWLIVWNEFKKGSEAAFESLYYRYVDALFRYGSKISSNDELVKDSIQQLFLELYSSKERLAVPDNPEFYLLKSLKRIIIHKLTKSNLNIEYQSNLLPAFEIEIDPEEKLVSSEREDSRIKLLSKILDSLPSDKKELLYLKFYSGLNNQQIGEMIGQKSATVQKQIIRILKKLQVNFLDQFLELFTLCFRA